MTFARVSTFLKDFYLISFDSKFTPGVKNEEKLSSKTYPVRKLSPQLIRSHEFDGVHFLTEKSLS
jgi:hypothetical protein